MSYPLNRNALKSLGAAEYVKRVHEDVQTQVQLLTDRILAEAKKNKTHLVAHFSLLDVTKKSEVVASLQARFPDVTFTDTPVNSSVMLTLNCCLTIDWT